MPAFRLLFVLSHAVALARGAEEASAATGAGGPLFMHIADPQLGMQHVSAKTLAGREDIKIEYSMLEASVRKAIELKVAFVFVGGDMQDAWADFRHAKESPTGGLNRQDAKALEDFQRKKIVEALTPLKDAKIPVFFTPGNHDVDDAPTEDTLAEFKHLYDKSWFTHSGDMVLHEGMHTKEPELWGRFSVRGKPEYHFLYITSQFYQDPHGQGAKTIKDYRANQLSGLRGLMKDIKKEADMHGTQENIVVIFTHIPPFMESAHEQEGWANWRKKDRTSVLDTITGQEIPGLKVVFICGHFHSNVVVTATYGRVPLHIIVTTSVGTTMAWSPLDGVPELRSAHPAAKVATESIGDAFFKYIMLSDPKNFAEIPKRLVPGEHHSGVRIFELGRWMKQSFFKVDELQRSTPLALIGRLHRLRWAVVGNLMGLRAATKTVYDL